MKHIFKSGLAAGICALLFMGCDKDSLPSLKTDLDPMTDLFGVVTDSDGNYMPGVVVSDGYSCAVTDENGVYQLTSNKFSYQVFVSIPEDCAVPMANGLPSFWKKITGGISRYDFTLEKTGATEDSFNLFCLADPQCQSTTNVNRFTSETVPDLYETVSASDLPSYGVVLGDIGWNTANNDYTNDVFPLMKKAMDKDKVGLPLFMAIGNHDNKVIAVKKDAYTVEHDIAAQRNFEYCFGPVNYSFNRGKVHVVVMDDIVFPNHDDYSMGFRDDQVEWLKQDLSFVSKDKMIILCVHIPIRGSSGQNVDKVLDLLKSFAGLHIMSGHTHYAENYVAEDRYEHVHAAVCGAWWHSHINVDGAPNGYGVYSINGTKIVDSYFKATGYERSFQIRLYRGNMSYMEGYTPNYNFYYQGDSDIIANIWNSDSDWTVKVYEDGQLSGEMKPFEGKEKRDAWASGYHRGVQGRGDNYDKKNNTHLFYYTLKNPAASVKVEAVDPHSGQTYTQTEFTGNTPEFFPAF